MTDLGLSPELTLVGPETHGIATHRPRVPAARPGSSGAQSRPASPPIAPRTNRSTKPSTKRTGLSIPPGLELNAWRELGNQIHVVADSSAWWLGDWLVYGQNTFPGRYRSAIEETSLDYQTLRNYAWVARSFTKERRRPGLSFQHHAEVAGLPPAEQDLFLSSAEADGWSRNELRRQIKAKRELQSGDPEEELVQVRMDLQRVKKVRWIEAAERAQKDLVGWIVTELDKAATR